jgi:hypothetical protein
VALPGTDPGETGVLICRKVFARSSNHAWQVTVWLYEDAFFAEREYRKNCKVRPLTFGAGEWLVWEPGQAWLGAVRDSVISITDQRKPPKQVADGVAAALGSQAWDDCGAVG